MLAIWPRTGLSVLSIFEFIYLSHLSNNFIVDSDASRSCSCHAWLMTALCVEMDVVLPLSSLEIMRKHSDCMIDRDCASKSEIIMCLCAVCVTYRLHCTSCMLPQLTNIYQVLRILELYATGYVGCLDSSHRYSKFWTGSYRWLHSWGSYDAVAISTHSPDLHRKPGETEGSTRGS